MINVSDLFTAANGAPVRRTHIRIPIRIASPGFSFGTVTATAQAAISKLSEVTDDDLTVRDNYATLEGNRWTLDGSMDILPDDYTWSGGTGFVSADLSDGDGYFSTPPTITAQINGMTVMQAVTIKFPDATYDGYAEEFTVTVSQGGTAYYSETVTGNKNAVVALHGFTVYDPDTISVSVAMWSKPYTRARIATIYPGYAANWDQRNVNDCTVRMQASISNTTTPYGTATVTINDEERLFDPRNKSGVFQALEEQQAVPIYIGVTTSEGVEYSPVGVYYQHDKGWTTRNSTQTIQWYLVDIVGLLCDTPFVEPTTTPTTLSGWVSALCASLGDALADQYTVDPNYAGISVVADSDALETIRSENCGTILRWLCQYTGTFARADQETGKLAVEPLWSQGNEYTLHDVYDMPEISANDSVATIKFRLSDGDYIVSGDDSTSKNEITVNNPFVRTETQALETARHILTAYGGERVSATGRGDPSSEIGDASTVQVDKSTTMTGRLVSQTLSYTGGMLRNCKMEFLRPNGSYIYESGEVITESGTWTVPDGVSRLSIAVVGGGGAGAKGENGTSMPGSLFDITHAGTYYGKRGADGANGAGGKVWHGTINTNPGQSFTVSIGAGGTYSGTTETTDGGDTTFGRYSSADGRTYTPAYTDAVSGNAYGRSGVSAPIDGSGDGGAGGVGGGAGYVVAIIEPDSGWPRIVEYGYGSPPGDGVPGASGCVVIYWSKGAA